ncbi:MULTISPECIES: Lrp/AsnC family transcriptional regulator [unclassified Undibacterium]|uniref:Lrp/AsnC family transcriptional regulator n=1 Tax=unclassified Undibacterium TaxID=2630295 RepID=UPI002AC9D90A|nr:MULTISPECIES: Lrp/AsnC family transcriptional regulator [unclassified Undibacterium]MEB0140467.1 Lrp/AsnC family transcriptional regulator [Undibacterium sp. CCC2.1]MEB0173710.1 Lrp/AsnC family transcriptional regulator [Undibacterium sp. CCC1.1]MEB0177710.1 Lrp/AsnC family transcriptional regulator [Undibacterium sp. CCC3.4]MEB0217007.1 Lrp/AsnC family transcriptional regulator [Undibacterium sp. 5I2]WPX44598.1 Lrp/AsnC family transcriptional regulator [Undibacterium sp. CCC3.4]
MTSMTILDELDKRILLQLQQDCAISNHELAARVHASPPTCLRRVKRLTDEGVIARQVALLAPEKLASSLTAIVEITLDLQASEKLIAFEALVASDIAVQQCYRVSPGPDFVLVIQVADMAAYHALAHRLFAGHSNIRNVRSFFSIFRSKFETRIAI